jgi:HPt (histidine-containing phosphotransfer) domain-containing protein
MDGFLAKPFTLTQLADAIAEAMPRTTPAIDLAQLGARCMHDAAFEARLIDLFLTSLDVRICGIADALALGEHDRLRERAHALKGAASNIAAGRLQSLALKLEDLGRSGELARAGELLEQLTLEARECREMLEAATRAHAPRA